MTATANLDPQSPQETPRMSLTAAISPTPPPFRVRFVTDARGEHRWQKVARNNRVIGASSEGYKDPRAAVRNLLDTMPGYLKVDGGLLNEDLSEDDRVRFIPVEIHR